MATYKPYRKVSSTEKEEIRIPYSVLVDTPNMSEYTKRASDETITGAWTYSTAPKMDTLENSKGNAIYHFNSSKVFFGQTTVPIALRGSLERPQYTTNGTTFQDIALKSDIVAPVADANAAKTYVYYVTGDGQSAGYDIEHPLGADVNVSVYLMGQSIFGETMDELVMVDVYTKFKKVKLVFNSAPSSDMKFKVVITGVEPEKIGTLEETSWEKIREIILAGNAADYWSVGDTKTVKIGGLSYTARLADLQDGRYEYSDGSGSSKAVFELLELYNHQTMSDFEIKTGSTTNGGWATSFLKKAVLDTWAWNNLTDDLKNVISKVKVLSSVGGTNLNETSSSDNRLFIPAVIELFDSPNGSLGLQESPLGQFDYYKTNNTNEARKKAPNNTTGTTQYWTRSLFTLGTDSFCTVEGDGSVTAHSVSYALGAAIIFAI